VVEVRRLFLLENTAEEREILHRALENAARCVTGRVIFDAVSEVAARATSTEARAIPASAQPLDRFWRRVFALIRFRYATRKLGTCVHDRCSLRLHCRFGGAGTAITAAFKAYADPASERLFTRRGEHHGADNQCNEDDSNPNGWFHARASLYPSYPWLRTARPHTGMPSARLPRFTGLRSTPC